MRATRRSAPASPSMASPSSTCTPIRVISRTPSRPAGWASTTARTSLAVPVRSSSRSRISPPSPRRSPTSSSTRSPPYRAASSSPPGSGAAPNFIDPRRGAVSAPRQRPQLLVADLVGEVAADRRQQPFALLGGGGARIADDPGRGAAGEAAPAIDAGADDLRDVRRRVHLGEADPVLGGPPGVSAH